METGTYGRLFKAVRDAGVVIGALSSILLGTGCEKMCDTTHCSQVPQVANGTKILAIGDSITAFYSQKHCNCCQSYSDYASIEISDYIQNEAVGGTQLSGGAYQPTIPRQYANAKASNGTYDVVILTAGGNDLKNECPLEDGQTCSVTCRNKMLEIADEMETLVADIVNDGSDVIIVGYYQVSELPSSVSKQQGYANLNECFSTELMARYQAIADSSPHVFFVNTADLANPYNEADYFLDGIHPSLRLAQKIGNRVAGVLQTM